MIKMVVSDIDGTLLEEGTDRLDPEFYEVIRELKKRGILFVAASGRQYASMMHVLEPVADDIVFITENGMNIIQRGETLMSRFIDRQLGEEVIRFGRGIAGQQTLLCTPYMQYLEEKNDQLLEWLRNGYHSKCTVVEDLIPYVNRANKISIYCAGGAAQTGQAYVERFGGRLNVLVSGGPWIDLMNMDADKGIAITLLQEKLGISAEETMAFGDNCNDIGMLGRAAENYAVANAHPDLIRAARHVTEFPQGRGVLHVLREKLLSE